MGPSPKQTLTGTVQGVNISDFAVPNVRLPEEMEMEDPHVINTVYGLSWGDGSLSEALGGTESPLCMALLEVGDPHRKKRQGVRILTRDD